MSNTFKYAGARKSFQSLNEPYFWTSVIKDWKPLLNDAMKMIIIQSLQWLTQNKFVVIYGYVIMPNHMHFIWEQQKMNGKETPKASFIKYTSHGFLKQLRIDNIHLSAYRSAQGDRKYLFWQRDPLAILIRSSEMASGILNYIHHNPLQPHWNLCDDPTCYRFSSARYYETAEDEFGILTHYMDRF